MALVDRSGAVVGDALRSAVRRENLLHAATGILVRRPDGRIYVHLRATDKDWAPGRYDACAGGVLKAGEAPEPSALRELEEELGIVDAVLRPLTTALYEDDTVRCFEHVYEVTYDGPIRHADGEVTWGDWMTLEDLGARLRDPSWPFVPDTRALLERLYRDRMGDYGLLDLDGPT